VTPLTSEYGPPPGSLRFFAVLFAPPAARPVLEALYGFDAEVRRSVEASSHDVAHTRLQWWRGEIDRLVAGRPSHPIAIALLPLRASGHADLALLHETLVAADLDLARLTYRTHDELDAYCYRASGALQTLAAAAVAGERALVEPERRFARQLGSAQRQAEMIRNFRHDLRRGRLYLPLDAIEAAGLDPLALERAPLQPAVEDLLAAWRARVAQALRTLPAALPDPSLRAAQRHGLVLAALHEQRLERTGRAPVASNDRVDVGPLKRLWTAWRTALRHA
jgi:15-cis-phytoene synthase